LSQSHKQFLVREVGRFFRCGRCSGMIRGYWDGSRPDFVGFWGDVKTSLL
jgi:hypothetical protein